ncbi:hypothetical protein L3X38_040394 [Prunus dulcis]|uniref:DNA-directed RNA polymerase n=1 Tax=Prunus dulcis TaxID=3755 RepID=A0AAD4VB68_PRUDU|nr:hypothetical protein L3X38_040394 [Prunus dulcis]
MLGSSSKHQKDPKFRVFITPRTCLLIRTSLQVLALQRESNSIDVRQQRTAFPPNFVHSLDGFTHGDDDSSCLQGRWPTFCRRYWNLHPAEVLWVHDSFWTHACDVDQMNKILRQKFGRYLKMLGGMTCI